MRIVILFAIAATAAFMAWAWYQPPCEGGAVVASEAECRAVKIFDANFCAQAWSKTAGIARSSGPTFPTDAECSGRYPVCIEKAPQGFGPKPGGWCLVRGASGEAIRIEPQYETKRG